MTQLLNGKEERSWFPDTEVASLMKIYRIRMSSLTGLTPSHACFAASWSSQFNHLINRCSRGEENKRFDFPLIWQRIYKTLTMFRKVSSTSKRKRCTMGTYIVAISGASGAPYALRLLQVLIKNNHTVYLSISGDGLEILKDETGLMLKGSETDIQFAIEKQLDAKEGQISYFDEDNMYATIASGSNKVDAMVVIPCSMKTLSAIAHGYASTLIERAADVTLKEQRKLIIVPRETPLSAIHLRNMLTLAELGCSIIPAMPAFYHRPKKITDLIDFIVGRVLDSMGIDNDLSPRWGM